MRTKCHSCLCSTCVDVCHCFDCEDKIKECKKYKGFKQISIFDTPKNPRLKSTPRYSWEYYGISKERYSQLTEYIQSGRYALVARHAAHTANKDIAEYLVMSIEKDLSYDDLERMWTLKEIERIPVGRSDFYGWRRCFFSIMNEKMKEIGK